MTDSPKVSTGYGQVMENLLNRWAKNHNDEFEFKHISWQSWERETKREEGYTVLPRGMDDYGFDILFNYLMKEKPDILLTLCDVGWQSGYINIIQKAKQNGWSGRWFAYTPIDTDTVAFTWKDVFNAMDIPIAMSKWGDDYMSKLGLKHEYIPHGVDTKVYKPLDEKTRNKNKSDANLKDKFVVGAVGRNQIRKQWTQLLSGFNKFSKGKDDVYLLLHTDMEPADRNQNSGWSMQYLWYKYDLNGKVSLTLPNMDVRTRIDITPDKMNIIYNLFDVFCFPTGGEGFGLPIIESISCGIPTLTTDFTTGKELTEKHGEVIPVLKDTYGREVRIVGCNGVEFVVADDNEVCNLLEKYYQDWKNGRKEIKRRSKLSRNFAVKNYDWDKISEQWIKLFKKYANN